MRSTFDDDDGIVDDNPDHQHHTKHGQHADRETRASSASERQQGDRHHDGQRSCMEILQNRNIKKHQQHGLDQCLGDLRDQTMRTNSSCCSTLVASCPAEVFG